MTRRAGVAVAIPAIVLVLLVPAGVRAQSTASGDGLAVSANASAVAEVEANRGAVIRDIVERWRPQFRPFDAALNVGGDEERFTAALQMASAERLLAASQAPTYGEALAAVLGRWQGPSVVPLEPGAPIVNALGDSGADLVFTPVTPCRIIDTRLATDPTKLGRIGPGAGKQFSVSLANYASQGGNAGTCNIPIAPAAVAINVTSTDQTGVGSLRVVETGGGIPTVSLLNYTPGVNLANAAVARSAGSLGGDNIFIYSQISATQVVVDIMGYFAPPVRTMPDQFVVSTGAVSIGVGTQSIFTTDCPAGYRLAGTAGLINSWTSNVVFIGARPTTGNSVTITSGANAGTQACCQFRNDAGASVTVACQAICLRIPGR